MRNLNITGGPRLKCAFGWDWLAWSSDWYYSRSPCACRTQSHCLALWRDIHVVLRPAPPPPPPLPPAQCILLSVSRACELHCQHYLFYELWHVVEDMVPCVASHFCWNTVDGLRFWCGSEHIHFIWTAQSNRGILCCYFIFYYPTRPFHLFLCFCG